MISNMIEHWKLRIYFWYVIVTKQTWIFPTLVYCWFMGRTTDQLVADMARAIQIIKAEQQ